MERHKDARAREKDIELADLEQLKRWCAWKQDHNAKRELTKIPVAPATGLNLPTNDPSTFRTRAEAESRWAKLKPKFTQGGIGIVLGDLGTGHHLVGIDLDNCLQDGTAAEWAIPVIDRFNTYTEISPSKKGLKLFFRVRSQDMNAVSDLLVGNMGKIFSAGEHFEIAIHIANRFFTVTDATFNGRPRDLRVVSVDDIRWLIQTAGPAFLDEQAPKEQKGERRQQDNSRSGYGFRFFQTQARAGKSFDEAVEAILADNGPAGEWGRDYVNERDQRQFKNAWSNASKNPGKAVKTYELVNAADVVPQNVRWLWKGHLAFGFQEIMTGPIGIAKSPIHCSLVATMTRGPYKRWPDGTRGPDEPVDVLMVFAEDAPADTIVPRLMAAGANLARVKFLRLIKIDNKGRPFILGEDIAILEEIFKNNPNIHMLTLDPITAFMGGGKGFNSNSASDVRSQLTPLNWLAERTGVAISTITHPTKSAGSKAMDHFTGSLAFLANARLAHICSPETKEGPGGETILTGRRLYSWFRGRQEMPTLVYQVNVDDVVRDRRMIEDVALIEWLGTSDINCAAAIAGASKTSGSPSRTAKVDEFLRAALADGPRRSDEIEAEGKAEGITVDQIKTARSRLRCHVEKEKGVINGPWLTYPPGSER